MRRIVFIVCGFIFILVCCGAVSPPLANARQGGKAVVAVLPAINNSGLRGGQYTAEMVNESLSYKFSADRYIVLSGQNLLERLRSAGVEDYSTTDSSSLQAAFRGMMVDYSVRAEVLYVATDQQLEFPTALLLLKRWTATVPLYMTVADVNNGTVLYDAVLTENGEHQAMVGFVKQSYAVRRALDKDLQRFGREFWLPE